VERQGGELTGRLRVGIIDGVRWCILRGEVVLDWRSLAISMTIIAVMLWFGARQFRRNENIFMDAI